MKTVRAQPSVVFYGTRRWQLLLVGLGVGDEHSSHEQPPSRQESHQIVQLC